MANFNRKHRRGLSSVVGAVFMVLVMIGALNVILLAMQQQDKVTQTVIEKSNSNVGKLSERAEISGLTVTGGKLNATVTNSGGAATKLVRIYIVNETAFPKTQYVRDLDKLIDGRKSVTNIGQNLNPAFIVQSNTEYSIRVVTQSGQSASATLGGLANHALSLSLYTIPPTIAPGSNATIMLAAQNNSTDNVVFNNVNALLSKAISCPAGATCNLVLKSSSGNNTVLMKGSTALFKWTYYVDAPDKTSITFTASLQGGVASNKVSEILRVAKLPASSADFYIVERFVISPDIFLTIPGPMGISSNDKSLWGIMLANPTDNYMNVSRVVISLVSIAGSSNRFVQSSCAATAIAPSSGWSCPTDNVIQWADNVNPIKIPGKSSYSFMVKVPGGSIGSQQYSALPIVATAFTTFGQFSKTGYASQIAPSPTLIGNVYVGKGVNQTADNQILGHINGLKANSHFKFNVTLTDFDTSSTTTITTGAKLIINVPKNWTVTQITPATGGGWQYPILKQDFSDGSTQIVAITASTLGSGSSAAGRTVVVEGTIPSVTEKRIAVWTITTEGTINSPAGFNIGALQEFLVQLEP